jgi:aromatic ring-opening dioxygenase catalytic subunit (LigB family)
MAHQRRAFFLSHGGGPLPILGEKSHEELVQCLKDIAATIPKPSAIIVVSAHWEERRPTITSGAHPALIYDYAGFPPESYTIAYPCPGEPSLAAQIADRLGEAGLESRLTSTRGFDHGLFIPLKIMYPEADIPCVQLSLLDSLDPDEHVGMGQALQSLGDQSLLVIGSGFSFHNMNAFFTRETDETRAMNEAFETWLLETCRRTDIEEQERRRRLVDWESAPSARYCHPREEHLLPLHVCYGFAATACTATYELHVLRKKASMYLWQSEG